MNDQQALREQLWDYCYGLSPAEEAALLELRIRSEPKVARLYAEVCLELELVGMAARVDDRAFQLPAEVIARTKREAVPHKKSRSAAKDSAASWNWLLAMAASGLIGLIAYGLIQPKQSADLLAGNFLAARVFAPGALADGAITEGITQRVELQTSDALSQPQSARVDVVVRDAAGQVQLRKSVVTASDGHAEVELPGDVLTVGSQLEVLDRSNAAISDSAQAPQPAIIAALPVRPAPKETYFFLESPQAEAGQPLAYSSVEVNQVTKQAAGPVVSRGLELAKDQQRIPKAKLSQNADRRQLERSEYERLASRAAGKPEEQAAAPAPGGLGGKPPLANAANGQLADLTDSSPGGVARGGFGGALKATPPSAAAAPNMPAPTKPATAAVLGEQAVPASPPSTLPQPKIAAADAKQRDSNPPAPAKGELAKGSGGQSAPADGLANLQSAPPPAPAAAALSGLPSDSADKVQRKALQTDENQSSRRNAAHDSLDQLQRFRDHSDQPPEALAIIGLEPVAVPLAEADRSKPLLARVRVGGEVVFQRALEGSPSAAAVEKESSLGKAQAAEVAVDIPPEIDGRIAVELLDLSVSPPRLAGQREVLRRSERTLSFAVEQIAGELKPGGKVKYRVQVQDEQGAPAAAAVSVRVWKADAVSDLRAALGDDTGEPLAKKSFADAPQQQNPLPSAQPAADAAAEGKAQLPGAAAPFSTPHNADRFAATQALRSQGAAPAGDDQGASPAVPVTSDLRWDNQALVAQRYFQALAAAEAEQSLRTQRIGYLLLGLGVVVLAAPWLLTACSRQVGRPVWWTAMGTSSLALVIGLLWATSHDGLSELNLGESGPLPVAESQPDSRKSGREDATATSIAAEQPSAELRQKSLASSEPLPRTSNGASPQDPATRPQGEPLAAIEKRAASPSPAALFWRPPLPLEQPGWLEFEVELPKEPGSYQILLDGFGQGRLGSYQHPLTISAGEQP